ncbi:MAG: aconitate hydratase [Planctomycetes bacterium]|nr:aconitate hydratase [Planctomycetota bacterium]
MNKKFYESFAIKLEYFIKKAAKPLTLAEKILGSHLIDPDKQEWQRGKSQLLLKPDRVAMQDVTGQMALLQFMQSPKKRTEVPATVHCDHLIIANSGAKEDIERTINDSREVFDFLSSACQRYGIGFWKPGAGIIHQVVLENYAFPGGLLIGTDSHTPNAGGLGMIAIGVGGLDAAEVMAGLPWEVLCPKIVGIHLKGKLNGWASPKDVIVKLLGILTVKGGTNKIIEYFGEGTKSISATGKATITNMGAELGATTSIFPYDEKTYKYLIATGREEIANLANKFRDNLAADKEVLENPNKFYDQVVEIDLDKLEPQIAGPFTPDLAYPISQFKDIIKKNNYPVELTACLIGSCTNSSYEDIGRASSVAKQALSNGLKVKTDFYITPGSDSVYKTVKEDGFTAPLEKIGGLMLANACGPCIGQWKRNDMKKGQKNSIITSFNRNFRGRNDGNEETYAFISSPEIVTAMSLAGRLDFNPITDEIPINGEKVKLQPPVSGELPAKGYKKATEGYIEPPLDGDAITVKVDPNSNRLQMLEPFHRWDGKDFIQLPILLKTKGKTTTDHISPAGPWLKFRGHLDKISDNAFLGATNEFTNQAGTGNNEITGEKNVNISKLARYYKSQGIRTIVIGDENYGEGSSREHAAMSPRYLNVAAVIVRGFARIHETNLKKQGILAVTFSNSADYNQIRQGDRISIINLNKLEVGKPIDVIIHRPDKKEIKILCLHSYTKAQIEWFKAGSALNILK